MRKKKGKNLIIGGIFSIFITIGFVFLAVSGLSEKIVKNQNMYSVNSSVFSQIINLPQKQDYVFKIKYELKNTDTDVVKLNGKNLELKMSKDKNIMRTRYYYAPKEIVRKGRNILEIKFYPSNPPNIDLRIRNYIASAAGKNIVITLKNSAIRKTRFVPVLIIGVFFFIFSLGLWIFWDYSGRLLHLSANQVLFNNILSFMPFAGIYFIFGIASVFSPFSLAFSPSYLFGLLFFGTLFFNVFLDSIAIYFSMQEGSISLSKNKYQPPAWLNKVFFWVEKREFSDKCILLFMFLLIMCAFLLILGMEWLAEQFANIAYLALVLGVVIKFVKMVREES